MLLIGVDCKCFSLYVIYFICQPEWYCHCLALCNLYVLNPYLFPGHCRPDVIEFDNLKRSNAHYNLQNAFNVAEKELGLTKLLDPEGEWVKPPQKHEAFLSQVTLKA